MKVSIQVLVPLAFGIFSKVSASVTPLQVVNGLNTKVCDGAVTLASTWIGEAKNVEIQSVFCPNSGKSYYQPSDVQHVLPPVEQPQLETAPGNNVCGAPCTTNCFNPAGGGPDPNDCKVIANALRFESENSGPLIDITDSAQVTFKFKSCETFFLNQDPKNKFLTYCRNDWASLIDIIAFNCQAKQNAHGGNCVAKDQRWFVQVNHK